VMEFFTVEDGFIIQERLVEEYQKATSISEKRSTSGKRGGQAKALKTNAQTLANAKQEPKHSQISEIIEEETREDASASLSEASAPDPEPKSRKLVPYPEAFEALWKAYPTDALMSKKAAFASWKRLAAGHRDLALASCPGFHEYCRKHPDYRVVHLTKYLKEERFLGFKPAEGRSPEQVFVERDSEAWRAWQRVKSTPSVTGEGGKTGWWFPAEWPEEARAA
jgi:hypothetical protein